MKRAEDQLFDLALRTFPAEAEVAVVGGPPVLPPRMASRRASSARDDEALPFLQARSRAPLDAIAAAWPTRFAGLTPFLSAMRGALKDEGQAILMDLVWQTAPTAELLRAFGAGREKVRPIEGYEMQLDHAGFAIRERVDVDRAAWAATLEGAQREAVEKDARGAARVVVWVLSPSSDA